MIGTQYLFVSFIVSDSSMYEELGMRTMHVVHGSGALVFRMESGDVLQVENVLWVPGVCSHPQLLRSRAIECCSRMDRCYWMPKGSGLLSHSL